MHTRQRSYPHNDWGPPENPQSSAAGAVFPARTGRLKLLAAEGESLPGEVLKIGHTLSRLRFALEPAPFIEAWCQEGPTHHCALGVGHVLGKIKKVAWLMGLELKIIGS